MVVIGIIMFLFSLTLFPYGYYMQRAYVERVADTVGQEWILAHKEIRNGKLLQSDTFAHANTLLVFRPQAQKIEKYYFSGSIDQIGDMSIDRLQQLEVAPSIDLDSSIRILSFSGTPILDQDRPLGYIIQAPL
jgi:lipopolysaccharide export LptBFGC system permease protein LptF